LVQPRKLRKFLKKSGKLVLYFPEKARRILSEIGITPLRLWGALDDERNRVSSFDVEERCL
jgi:hypothetical protein